jgi:hypothetical protein
MLIAVTAMVNSPSHFRVELINGWSVAFGTSATPSNGELSTIIMYVTAQWNESAKQYDQPWKVRLEAQQRRVGETGETLAKICPATGTWDDSTTMPEVPLCAMMPPTYIEATREKEIKAVLKFGRDSNWPLRITIVAEIYLETSISITYQSGWEDCDSSEAWAWTQFAAAAQAVGLI